MNKTLVSILGIVAFTILVGLSIWTSSHRYQVSSGRNGVAYEVDKKTGQSWELMADTKILQVDPVAQQKENDEIIDALEEKLPIEEQSKVTGSARLSPGSVWDDAPFNGNFKYFSGQIYNGSASELTRVVFTIGVVERNGTPVWSRDYSQKVNVMPLQNASFEVSIGELDKTVNFTWSIKEVYGIQNAKDFLK